jgi:hypothetical protein
MEHGFVDNIVNLGFWDNLHSSVKKKKPYLRIININVNILNSFSLELWTVMDFQPDGQWLIIS